MVRRVYDAGVANSTYSHDLHYKTVNAGPAHPTLRAITYFTDFSTHTLYFQITNRMV